jgi:hypothetical protein
MARHTGTNQDLLAMALVGYEAEKAISSMPQWNGTTATSCWRKISAE